MTPPTSPDFTITMRIPDANWFRVGDEIMICGEKKIVTAIISETTVDVRAVGEVGWWGSVIVMTVLLGMIGFVIQRLVFG